MKKLSILFFVCTLVCFQMTAQSSKTYDLDKFNAIAITNSADVVFSTGPQAVSVTGSADLVEKLDIYVEKGTLKITSKKGKKGNWYGKKNIKVTVSAPSLRALAISGSSDFFSESSLDEDSLWRVQQLCYLPQPALQTRI